VTYECDLCGGCCRTFPIFASESDARREPRIALEGKELAPHLQTPDWKLQLYPLPFHETCCFLETDNRCTIYETRPDVCRRFEAGSEQCQEARRRLGLAALEPVMSH
jgi:Fe-S-cluster containining protein